MTVVEQGFRSIHRAQGRRLSVVPPLLDVGHQLVHNFYPERGSFQEQALRYHPTHPRPSRVELQGPVTEQVVEPVRRVREAQHEEDVPLDRHLQVCKEEVECERRVQTHPRVLRVVAHPVRAGLGYVLPRVPPSFHRSEYPPVQLVVVHIPGTPVLLPDLVEY